MRMICPTINFNRNKLYAGRRSRDKLRVENESNMKSVLQICCNFCCFRIRELLNSAFCGMHDKVIVHDNQLVVARTKILFSGWKAQSCSCRPAAKCSFVWVSWTRPTRRPMIKSYQDWGEMKILISFITGNSVMRLLHLSFILSMSIFNSFNSSSSEGSWIEWR